MVSGEEILKAIAAIPASRAYAVAVALAGGVVLVIGGLATLKRLQHISVLSIATGTAALLSAIIVLKHYETHYTAGISATLPACAVAGYLLFRARGVEVGRGGLVVVVIALGFQAWTVIPVLKNQIAEGGRIAGLVAADRKEIDAQIAAGSRTVEFIYRVPFVEYGEGFVLVMAGIPQLTEEYLRLSRRTISNIMARYIKLDIGMYVIDKKYFPDEEAIRRATTLDIPEGSGSLAVRYEAGDRLIELQTVFLLIRH